MNPKQALQILDEATQPANAQRISRGGYYATEMALQIVKDILEKGGYLKEEPPTEKPEENV